jgi:hypothetical protein
VLRPVGRRRAAHWRRPLRGAADSTAASGPAHRWIWRHRSRRAGRDLGRPERRPRMRGPRDGPGRANGTAGRPRERAPRPGLHTLLIRSLASGKFGLSLRRARACAVARRRGDWSRARRKGGALPRALRSDLVAADVICPCTFCSPSPIGDPRGAARRFAAGMRGRNHSPGSDVIDCRGEIVARHEVVEGERAIG